MMPDFLTPIAALASLIASALSRLSINRAAKLDTKMEEVLRSNEELRSEMDELKTMLKVLLRREKKKRHAQPSSD